LTSVRNSLSRACRVSPELKSEFPVRHSLGSTGRGKSPYRERA
jgi:hypothetical protein